MKLWRKITTWWDRKVNWEYYATLDFIERTVPPEQIAIISVDKKESGK